MTAARFAFAAAMASLKEAIKNTQNSLGKIVKKPPLRDKELTRPPFRFLHDVISAVIKVCVNLEAPGKIHMKTLKFGQVGICLAPSYPVCVTCFNRGGETWHEYLAIKRR